MMKIYEKFCTDMDAIERDPFAALKRGVNNVLVTELGNRGLSEAQQERFASGPVTDTYNAAKASYEDSGFVDTGKRLLELRDAIRQRVAYERASGELRPVSVQSEIQRCGPTLHHYKYLAAECAAIEAKMVNGEKITAITWGAIETDRQVILRREMPGITRPSSFMDGDSWRRGFVSDAAVERAQADEAARLEHVNTSGRPSRWIE